MSILQVNELVKTFGRRRVVDGVTLNVYRGEIVGLLGPNGAGKTTTFRMICGQLKPDRGAVTLAGKDVTEWPMFQRARYGGMGYLPQQSSIFAKLTVQQNLIAMMQLLKMDRKTQKRRCDELLEQFKIGKLRKSKAGKLSGGERRRLEIARCLVSDPEIIMLDEPFAGIDPVTVQNIQEVIQELREAGLSILITDHAAREILQITDRTYVVSEGQILCSGSADEIVQNEEVKTKYLGEIDFVRSARLDQLNAVAAPKIKIPEELPKEDASVEDTYVADTYVEKIATVEPLPLEPTDVITESMVPVEDEIPTLPLPTAASQIPQQTHPTATVDTEKADDTAPGKKRKKTRLSIRKPKITQTELFSNIEAPFNSNDLE